MQAQESPTFAAVSPLGRALWRLVTPADMDGLKPVVANWIADERWAQVESSYAEASLALRKLGRVGPAHAALASRFRERAPALFLLLCASKAGPFADHRASLADIVSLCVIGRDSCVGYLSEEECREVEAIILEGAGIGSEEHDRAAARLSAEVRALVATTWPTMGVASPAPRVFCYNRFRMPGSDRDPINTFARSIADGRREPFVEVSLPAIALSMAASQHCALEPGLAAWDPCRRQASTLDLRHIVTHELVHAASTGPVEPWTGEGGQAYLSEAKARLEAASGERVLGIRQRGLVPVPKMSRASGDATTALLALAALDEGFVEADTLDRLGRPHPGPGSREAANVYGEGARLARALLGGRAPRDVLLAPDKLAAFAVAVKATMTRAGAELMLDLVFERSAEISAREDLPAVEVSDRDAYGGVVRVLAAVLAADRAVRAP